MAWLQSLPALPWYGIILGIGCLFAVSRNWFGVSRYTEPGMVKRPHVLSIIFTLVCLLLTVESLHMVAKNLHDSTPTLNQVYAISFFIVITLFWLLFYLRKPLQMQQYFFAFVLSTFIAFACLLTRAMILSEYGGNGFIMALVSIGALIIWKTLFADLSVSVKSTMLGTFIWWVAVYTLAKLEPGEHLAFIIAALVALVPACLWCYLFLEYHTQRLGVVLLMFFAGMLSTVPILFYDFLIRSDVELNFFLFRLIPESFVATSNSFVVSSVTLSTALHSKVIATLLSFMIVGCIEELSKFWVLKRSGGNTFTSIDDVMQLAIIVAIGFAFAENIVNPTYFQSFVRIYILEADTPNWSAFFGNVFGRSILTNMVHIVSTGIMGYFFGLMLFARPYLEDAHMANKRMPLLHALVTVFHIPERLMFKREMLIIGAFISITLHGVFNFVVSIPQILPGNPSTLGDIFNAPSSSWMHGVALILPSALLYVVGGFWVLSMLFYRKENMKEFGHLLQVDTYVHN